MIEVKLKQEYIRLKAMLFSLTRLVNSICTLLMVVSITCYLFQHFSGRVYLPLEGLSQNFVRHSKSQLLDLADRFVPAVVSNTVLYR